jgi:O-methyltransferase
MKKRMKRKLGRTLFRYVSSRNWTIVNYDYAGKREVLKLIKSIKNEIKTHLSENEAVQLFTISRSVEKIKGDFAEVGVYAGGSAKILSKTKKEKKLHLFDTFQGLPEKTKRDIQKLNKNDFNYPLEKVKENLKNEENILYYKGMIKETSSQLKNKRFSFVHLDVDLYDSTLSSLNFFYKRMNPGGVIISHDYFPSQKHGVTSAFNNFFKDKEECVIEISDTQCMVVKIK